jgi:hypothetical protein
MGREGEAGAVDTVRSSDGVADPQEPDRERSRSRGRGRSFFWEWV